MDPVSDLAPDAVASDHISKVLFVNRCVGGCPLTSGSNDSRINTSTIVDGSSVLSEFSGSDAVWDEMIECIKYVYAPYDIQIVEEDPGDSMFHHEAIVAGLPGEIGLSNGFGGIAPSGCAPLNNVISFTFGNLGGFRTSPLRLCSTLAQESAHSFGLPNHVFNCLDPMTYLSSCGQKLFRNQNYPCGEYEESPCNCSGATQNSHLELLNVFGPGSTEIPPPQIDIAAPRADEKVSDGFTLIWSAVDPRLVRKNEVWVNGTKVLELPGNAYEDQEPGYQIEMPSLPDGYLDIEVHSFNDLNVESVAERTVLKGEACANKDACFAFQSCEDGRCVYAVASRGLGEGCNVSEECAEGVCSDVSGDKRCSVSCNPNVLKDACIGGLDCVSDVEGQFVCFPKEQTGGCCSIAGTQRDPLPWLGIGLFLMGLVFLRKKNS